MKKLNYGNWYITVLKQMRDGKVFSEIQHKSGLKKRVIFKDADAINSIATKMYNGKWDMATFTPSQKKLIKDWEKEDTKFKSYLNATRKQDTIDIEKGVSMEKPTVADNYSLESTNKSQGYGDASEEYRLDVLINKVIRENEHEGIKLRDILKNAGVEPRDFNAMLSKIRNFCAGKIPHTDEEVKAWILRYVESFKKAGGTAKEYY